MIARTHFVYEAYDDDGLLLYVGCTGKPTNRYRAHMSGDATNSRHWFGRYVTHWRVSGPYPKRRALDLERERVRIGQPIWNAASQDNKRGFGLVRQYLAFHGVNVDESVATPSQRPYVRDAA